MVNAETGLNEKIDGLRNENQCLKKEIEQRNAELSILNTIQQGLVMEISYEGIINLVGDKLRETLHYQDVGIRIYDKKEDLFYYPYEYEHGEKLNLEPTHPGAITGWVLRHKRMLHIRKNDEEGLKKLGIEGLTVIPGTDRSKSLVAFPIMTGEDVIGIFSVENYEKEDAFSESDIRLFTTLVSSMSIALKNARLFEETKGLLNNLKSTQHQLIVQEKLASLGQLTAGIAHEIKNPLNFVNNFAEISIELTGELKEEIEKLKDIIPSQSSDAIKELLEELKGNAKRINQQGKRADSIVRAMLLHSRGKTGERQETDINAILEEDLTLAFHGMRARDASFNVTIEKDLDYSIGKISVVPQDISRVFINVINNGFYEVNKKRKGNKDNFKPVLWVFTRNLKDKVQIRIKDNGNGIPAEIQDKLFHPFFTTKPSGEGTGLGLSLSYDIVVKQHLGEIRFKSKEGEYTEFIISLPRNRSKIF